MILLLSDISVAQFPKTNAYDLNSVSDNSVEEIVYTPFGPAKKSNIHYIDSRHYLNINDGNIQVVQKNTGIISRQFAHVLNKTELSNNETNGTDCSSQYNQIISSQYFKDGWITYADTYFNKPIVQFSAHWIVPLPPERRAEQLLYIFNGLQGSDSVVSHILQPVLQWGVSPAGGGKYWSVCNWYVTSKEFFHDSLIIVRPGNKLDGLIKQISSENNLFSYLSSFKGFQTSLQVNNLPQLDNACVALEAYNVADCKEYPADNKVKVTNIQIITEDNYPSPLLWTINNSVSDCGQFTEVVSNSPNNGEINIHFRTGNSTDFFRDIHIYPNPLVKILHIIPEETLLHCAIEIFNNSGQLIFSNSYDYLDNEFTLDLGNYADGLYFIKFSYYSRYHLIKKNIHTFKIIKAGKTF